ncbi:MAG: cellobiose phosphorylase [Chloroflexi bacterium]|nr:cellobiose phosphorylase [Chloroflexota bacterium]
MSSTARGSTLEQAPPPIAAELRNASGLAIAVLENGSIFAIRHGDILINQVFGSPLEGGLGNVYLRRRRRAGIAHWPVVGPAGASGFRASSEGASWDGSFDGIDYVCTLRLAATDPTWFWTIELTNTTHKRVSVDVVLAQDLGIAQEAAVRTSELYTSQYIDHTALEDPDFGLLLCSRQNLPQGGAFPWVMHGCLAGSAGYLTDGFQFHGLASKASGAPAALSRPRLPNATYQYEQALATLQSRAVGLAAGASGAITFFGAFAADHPAASGAPDVRRARAAAKAFRALSGLTIGQPPQSLPRSDSLFDRPALFQSDDLVPAELEAAFGTDWRHVEEHNGTLRSFFHGEQEHVVLKAKEIVQERPTGHVLRSGRDLLPSDETMSVTGWMFGAFAAQLTIGNTSLHKLLSVCRDPLNVLKSSGLRIFIRTDRGQELLGPPSAFEMGPSGATWHYRDRDRGLSLAISLAVSIDEPVCRLTVDIEDGGPLELLVCHNVVLGEHEFDDVGPIVIHAADGRIELRPAPTTLMARRYPEARFAIAADPDRIAAIGGDGLLHADGVERGGPYVVIRTKPLEHFALALSGDLLGERATTRPATRLGAASGDGDRPSESEQITAFWSELGRAARLSGGTGSMVDGLSRLDDVLRWYLHDALIHATTPHGLEQSGGAAWGLRDVCQGPTELFVATGQAGALREVLRIVYANQDRKTGDWPQWFMLDRHREIRAPDSHGDIIHWPIKALCDYIEATNDVSILDEQVAWTDARTGTLSADTDTIFAHTERQIATIERDCIPGTALVVFAGGDWEDTLQPVDPSLARRLVSSWTVELAYQTLGRYRTVCERAGRAAMAARLADLCDRMRADFQRHLVPDGIVAGLAEFGPDGIAYFLHPRDRQTGVDYRLLPMTRGMSSEMFTVEQAERHAALIERHLRFPDGVRLMDRPMEYRGGPSRIFKRAESAANFGREVGLQYVHAHIRYVEAMAKMGRPDDAFRGLLAICPIGLERAVPSALPRQSNAFFSSSDGAFRDRYEARREFHRLRSGRVGVKGGWRVYSSGPGIYINQLVSNVLGLRTWFNDVVIDPVLPRDANGLTFDIERDGRAVRYLYHVAGEGFGPREIRVNGRPLVDGRTTANPYRRGGFLVERGAFDAALDRNRNVVEIFV